MAAFRRSEMKFPSLSYFVAAVDPEIALIQANKWKSIPKQQRKKTQKWEQQLKSKTLCLAVLTDSTVPAALNRAISVTWPSLRMVRMTINRYQLSKLASYLTIKNLFCICLARLCIWSFSLKTMQKKFIYRDFPHDCQGVSLSGALNTWLYHSKKIK